MENAVHRPAADGLIGSTFEVRLAGQPFQVSPTDRQLVVSRAPASDPVATIAADPETLQAILWHGRKLPSWHRGTSRSRVTIRGARASVGA